MSGTGWTGRPQPAPVPRGQGLASAGPQRLSPHLVAAEGASPHVPGLLEEGENAPRQRGLPAQALVGEHPGCGGRVGSGGGGETLAASSGGACRPAQSCPAADGTPWYACLAPTPMHLHHREVPLGRRRAVVRSPPLARVRGGCELWARPGGGGHAPGQPQRLWREHAGSVSARSPPPAKRRLQFLFSRQCRFWTTIT